MIFSFVLFLGLMVTGATALAHGFLVKEGMRGDSVRAVQKLLIARGYLADNEADGICGAKTTAAITKFQQENNLEVDGICGRMTYMALSGGEEPPVPEVAPSRGGGRSLMVSATAYSRFDPGLSFTPKFCNNCAASLSASQPFISANLSSSSAARLPSSSVISSFE